jgi:hypothetical protein
LIASILSFLNMLRGRLEVCERNPRSIGK